MYNTLKLKQVILGTGTGGTMMAHHLSKEVDNKSWSISIILYKMGISKFDISDYWTVINDR